MSVVASVTDISAELLTCGARVDDVAQRLTSIPHSRSDEFIGLTTRRIAESVQEVKNAHFRPVVALSCCLDWFKVMSVVCGPLVALVKSKFGPAAFPR